MNEKQKLENWLEQDKRNRPAYYPEGFHLMDYIRVATDENGANELVMDIKYRLYWLHLVYPEAVIRTKIIEMDGGRAVMKAAIYKNAADTSEQSLAEGTAIRFLESSSDENQYERYYVDLAETYAKGRALHNMGFDLILPPDFSVESYLLELAEPQADLVPKTDPVEEKPAKSPAPTAAVAAVAPAGKAASAPPAPPKAPVVPPAAPVYKGKTIQVAGVAIPEDYETAKQILTYELALEVPAVGKHKDKTLGAVAIEDPSYISWLVKNDNPKYKNVIRAAAEILLNHAAA